MSLEVVPAAESGFPYDDPAPETPTARPEAIKASPTSSMGSLRNRLAKQKAERSMLKWVLEPTEDEPGILVEYRPIDWEELEEIRASHKKAGKKQGILVACDILITACLGIYTAPHAERDKRGEWEPLTEDEPTTYASRELGQWLSDPDKGLEVKTARQCVRNLYPDDGPVMGTGDELVKFSGYLGDEATPRPN